MASTRFFETKSAPNPFVVWLRSVYGDDRLCLTEPFTYADWRDAFFNPTHPKGKKFPTSMTPLVPVPELLLTGF